MYRVIVFLDTAEEGAAALVPRLLVLAQCLPAINDHIIQASDVTPTTRGRQATAASTSNYTCTRKTVVKSKYNSYSNPRQQTFIITIQQQGGYKTL